MKLLVVEVHIMPPPPNLYLKLHWKGCDKLRSYHYPGPSSSSSYSTSRAKAERISSNPSRRKKEVDKQYIFVVLGAKNFTPVPSQ